MKYFLGAALLLLFSCHRPLHPVPEPIVHTGKVVRSVCGNITIQFTDGTQWGQRRWKDPSDSMTYDFVFRVANPCTWGKTDTNKNIRFIFTGASAQNCVQCLAWAPTPDTAYNIKVVQ